MSQNPWFAFYPADFLAKTAHLSMIERGVYFLLMSHYYATGKALPNDEMRLSRICHANDVTEITAVKTVISEFFTIETDGLLHNKRCDKELIKQKDFKDEQSRKGKLSAQARWGNRKVTSVTEAQPDCNQPHLHLHLQKSNTTARNGKLSLTAKGEWQHLTAGQIELWKSAYPALDVMIELNKASAWLMANPKNKKSNYPRFLTNWLSRAQDRAPKAETGEISRMGKFVI